MSRSLPIRPRIALAHENLRYAIVASEYNAEYVQPLIDNACNEIYREQPTAVIELFRVPGAFEIPLLVKLIAAKRIFDVVIALGVIIRGQTAHAELIAGSVTDSLQRIALEFERPVVHEVLLVENDEQAEARCRGEELNRGREAAVTAMSIARTFHSIEDLR